jgi:hypothetical protein
MAPPAPLRSPPRLSKAYVLAPDAPHPTLSRIVRIWISEKLAISGRPFRPIENKFFSFPAGYLRSKRGGSTKFVVLTGRPFCGILYILEIKKFLDLALLASVPEAARPHKRLT